MYSFSSCMTTDFLHGSYCHYIFLIYHDLTRTTLNTNIDIGTKLQVIKSQGKI